MIAPPSSICCARTDPRQARREAFEVIAPAFAPHGYKMSIVGSALIFRRQCRPGWTIALAIFAFPFGLFALLHKEVQEIVVEIEPGAGGGTSLLAHGVGSLAVRRAFAQLS